MNSKLFYGEEGKVNMLLLYRDKIDSVDFIADDINTPFSNCSMLILGLTYLHFAVKYSVKHGFGKLIDKMLDCGADVAIDDLMVCPDHSTVRKLLSSGIKLPWFATQYGDHDVKPIVIRDLAESDHDTGHIRRGLRYWFFYRNKITIEQSFVVSFIIENAF